MSTLIKRIHEACYARGWTWPYPTQQLIFDKDVPDNVNFRTQNYIEKHKQALQQQPEIIQQQQQILESQHAPGQENVQPQAQQIGIGTPNMETPVWLQKAAQSIVKPVNQSIAPVSGPTQVVIQPTAPASEPIGIIHPIQSPQQATQTPQPMQPPQVEQPLQAITPPPPVVQVEMQPVQTAAGITAAAGVTGPVLENTTPVPPPVQV